MGEIRWSVEMAVKVMDTREEEVRSEEQEVHNIYIYIYIYRILFNSTVLHSIALHYIAQHYNAL